ncbi:MAG: WbqC family protein [Gilvibacter sp.]
MESIVVHPAYYASIETMAWVAQAKEVFLEVCDNYQKQTYRNRCNIAHSNGLLTLTIPIRHSKTGERQKTTQVTPESNFTWQRDHWRSIQTAYRTSPYFEFYEDEFAPLYDNPPESLMQLNLTIFNLLVELLGIDSKIEHTASFQIEPSQTDARFLINCKRNSQVSFTPYLQVFETSHGFLENLSVLDLLFNEGPNAITYLESFTLVAPQ